jgi:hypothetical protein
VLLDQANLPDAVPALDLLLACDGFVNVGVQLVPDENVDAVLLRELPVPNKMVGHELP